MDGRTGPTRAQATRCHRVAVPGRVHVHHVAPQVRILERCEVIEAGAESPKLRAPPASDFLSEGFSGVSLLTPFAFSGVAPHDGALLRHDLPVLAALPLRPFRKGHGFRNPRRRPFQQARRRQRHEPLRPGAHPGRA
ncbi:hypothetical protein THIARS_40011 [Thiomonas delicata]|uniref:Uncharacterized protein n=1 Tax=Thiomonas delicata TaxID=364030 RepID=A0A238CZH3_THIDL|nr:hypothetical protein THIARS_40011 [Thiomonas delicata]